MMCILSLYFLSTLLLRYDVILSASTYMTLVFAMLAESCYTLTVYWKFVLHTHFLHKLTFYQFKIVLICV